MIATGMMFILGLVADDVGRQDLERHLAVHGKLRREVDLSHGALAEIRLQPEPAQDRAGADRHRGRFHRGLAVGTLHRPGRERGVPGDLPAAGGTLKSYLHGLALNLPDSQSIRA